MTIVFSEPFHFDDLLINYIHTHKVVTMLGFVEAVDKFVSFHLGTYQPECSNIPGKHILGFVGGNFSR